MVGKLGGGAGICGNSVPSSQLCHEPKAVVRNIFLNHGLLLSLEKSVLP